MSSALTSSLSVSFSSLLKSRISFTRRCSLWTLREIMSSSFLSGLADGVLAVSWETGPEIIVSGVRNSCDMFAKNFMFMSFTLFSSAVSISARSLACFSLSAALRRRMKNISRPLKSTAYSNIAHVLVHIDGMTLTFREFSAWTRLPLLSVALTMKLYLPGGRFA